MIFDKRKDEKAFPKRRESTFWESFFDAMLYLLVNFII
ncbi:hypothetical protein B4119_3841 [Parageobacillus caldoxylosilyticus]|uniref:Uncharacterized protein n=1 Tax=Saccharococcus caldoxylosilyticus TaxID=81408 RepID=A0A150M3S6_9BACL|nr:hypothetical protein B4119_3841 [Parageobacillus caldoxylosilyticus]